MGSMYRMHRVFCAAPWELESERRVFYDVIGNFNELAAMPRGILYVTVSLVAMRDKRPYQYTVEENIRDCRHYLLALGEDWGPVERNFEPDFRLATACLRDPSLPMQSVSVLLRAPEDGGPPPLASRLLAAGVTPVLFQGSQDFREKVVPLLHGWLEADSSGAAASSTT